MSTSKVEQAGGAGYVWVDDRVPAAKYLKKQLNKVFPDHWSFMLGEIALYSFIILLLSGTFLSLWFKPSMIEVVYDGSYLPLNGVKMSEAYASTLDISFDVRGGLSHAPDPPLGCALLRRSHLRPPAAGLLHRRLPQAA